MNLSRTTLKDLKRINRCFNLTVSEKDLADIALGGLHLDCREKLEGFVYYSINGLQLRAMSPERKFKEAEESFKAHQSNARVDCQSNTSKRIIWIWITIRLC